jgi:hypothetical protein
MKQKSLNLLKKKKKWLDCASVNVAGENEMVLHLFSNVKMNL